MKTVNLLIKGNSTTEEAPLFQIGTAFNIEVNVKYTLSGVLYEDTYFVGMNKNPFTYNIDNEIKNDDVIIYKKQNDLYHEDLIKFYYGDDIINNTNQKLITVVYKCLGSENDASVDIKYNERMEYSINWCYPNTIFVTTNNGITFNTYNFSSLTEIKPIDILTKDTEFIPSNTIIKLQHISSRKEYNHFVFWYQDASYAINQGFITVCLNENKVFTPHNISNKIKFYYVDSHLYIHIIANCVLKKFSNRQFEYSNINLESEEELSQIPGLVVTEVPTETSIPNGALRIYDSNGFRMPIFKSHSGSWITADGFTAPFSKKGNTYNRPTLTAEHQGFQFYDYTLNKPIWWTGEKWVDATGADV